MRPVLVLLLACVAVLAGCAGPRPVDDRTLVLAVSQQPECLDPQVSPREITALTVRGVFDSLVAADRDGTLRPWLAESWTVAPDRRSYTFRLRDGVRFHDGTPLDAAAVKATLDHAVDPVTKSRYAAVLLSRYTGADVLDPRTVRVNLGAPDSSLLQALSTAYLGIQSPTSMRVNAGSLCSHPVGSGPLRFVEWRRNRDVSFVRNPDYRWAPPTVANQGPMHVDGVRIDFLSEDSARFGALTSGQADIVNDLPPSKAGTLRADRSLRYLRADNPGVVYTIGLNSTDGPLRDERVRRALTRAVRVDQLVRSVSFGEYPRAWSMLGPSTPGYAPDVAGTWPYDPALAARLLDEAGWTGRDAEGFRTRGADRLTLTWPYLPETQDGDLILMQGIQAELRRAGVDMRIVAEDAGTYVQQTTSGKGLDMYGTTFLRAQPDVLRYWFGSAETVDNGGGNVFHVRDATLDGLLGDALAGDDPAARLAGYARAQHYINDRALAMPVYVPVTLLGTTDRVTGVTFEAAGFPLLNDVTLDGRS